MKYIILFLLSTSVVSSVINRKKSCELLRRKARLVLTDFGVLTSVIPESECGEWLYINNPNISSLGPNAFQNFSNIFIKKLIINNKYKFLHISTKSLTYLSNLQILKIQAIVFCVDPTVFTHVPLVRELKVALNYHSETILKNILSKFRALRHLTIFKSKNLTIVPDMFESVALSLRHLEFVNNTIKQISESPFTLLKELVTLKFENNNFAIDFDSSKEKLFEGLSRLQYLSITGHENITQISKNIFSKLPELKELNLEGNKIKTIVSGCFYGLSLDVLNLKNNQLEIIKIGAFDGLQAEQLYLQGNDKIDIEEDAFDNNCIIGNDGI